jgi:hypothetical protein
MTTTLTFERQTKTLIDDLKFSNGFVTGDLTVGGTVTAQKLIVEFTTVTTQIVRGTPRL